jgi:hypothetical protein
LRTGAVPSGTDVKLYDVGNFFVGTTGGVNTDPIGKLYVEYEVEFFVPQKESASGSSGASFAYTAADQTGTQAYMDLATTTTALISASTAPVAGTFTVPKGNFAVTVRGSINSAGNAGMKMLVDGVEATAQSIVWYVYSGGSSTGEYNITFVLSLNAQADVKFQILAPSGATVGKQLILFSALC